MCYLFVFLCVAKPILSGARFPYGVVRTVSSKVSPLAHCPIPLDKDFHLSVILDAFSRAPLRVCSLGMADEDNQLTGV